MQLRFLIIGQGLAGTLTGFRLERAGHRVHYVDAPGQTAASSVAAGIVNPITGRRYVKSWRIDELIPVARELYTEIGDALGVQLWYDLPLIRTLYNRGEENDWLARSADPGYSPYMDDHPDTSVLAGTVEPVFAYAGIRHATRVDIGRMTALRREELLAKGLLDERPCAYGEIDPTGHDHILYRGERYDRVICCEGWRARHNPWFGYLPHGGNKGEVLIVRTGAPLLPVMFKHRVFIVPRADGTYWIGATSENRFGDDGPTEANRNFLAERLAEVLTVPYEIVEQQAAVRPTVRDRRMFIGPHPEHDRLFILNGLGTKGASLAPLGSRWLVEHLLEDKPLPAEVDIARFG